MPIAILNLTQDSIINLNLNSIGFYWNDILNNNWPKYSTSFNDILCYRDNVSILLKSTFIFTNIHFNKNIKHLKWTTNIKSNSQVRYGLTKKLEKTSPLHLNLVLDHSVILFGIQKNKSYFYQLYSRDSIGNLYSSSIGSFRI